MHDVAAEYKLDVDEYLCPSEPMPWNIVDQLIAGQLQ
jgi:hypothetical protein